MEPVGFRRVTVTRAVPAPSPAVMFAESTPTMLSTAAYMPTSGVGNGATSMCATDGVSKAETV